MRTKLVLGAAALAAGLATSAMAQSNVYSLNVVGYYNLPIAAGAKVMIANQLNTTNNTISSLLQTPTVPGNSILFKYNGGFTGYTFDPDDLVWTPNGDATLNPGEGAFFQASAACTLTFVGEVLQGSLTNTLPLNAKNIRASIVPQAGLVTTDLGVPPEGNDVLYTYHGAYTGYTFDPDDLVWTPVQPSVAVGESFFYQKSATATQSKWVRNFTVQ